MDISGIRGYPAGATAFLRSLSSYPYAVVDQLLQMRKKIANDLTGANSRDTCFDVTFDLYQTTLDMKYFFILVLITVCSSCLAQADIGELKKLNESWIGSYPKRDTATLGRILANDLVMINPSGTKLTKADVLRNTATSSIKSARVDSVEVRLLGNVALVIAKASFVYTSEGKEITGRTSYMDIYEKRKGKWTAVAAHVTSIK